MKNISKLGIALLGITAMGVQAGVTQMGSDLVWIDGSDLHTYKVYEVTGGDIPYAWSTANTAAQAIGLDWELASSLSATENSLIWSKIASVMVGSEQNPRQLWLGGYNTTPGVPNSPTWAWSNGDTWNGAYQPFAAGEPNGDDGGQWNGHITIGRYDTQQWNDEGSWPTGVRGFVAEQTLYNAVPEPSAYATMFGLAGMGWAGYRRFRK